MRILFLCHKTPYPANDGGAIATLNMIKGFAHHGDDVSVLSMQTPKHSFAISNLPESLKGNIHWSQVFVNTEINIVKLLFNLIASGKPYNAERFISKTFKTELGQLLSNKQFDVIQLEGAYLGAYVPIIREFSNAKISLRAHNVEYEIWERLAQNEVLSLKRFYYNILAKRVKKLETNLLKQIDLLVPITLRDANVLTTNITIPTHVSSTGMDDEVFGKSEPKNKNTLFYIGALDWIPNQDALKWFVDNIWCDLKTANPEWHFVIAGRNAPESFEQYLKTKPVRYEGEVDSATDFIDEHNIMVVPLQSGSGMRIKIIEGMARGKCIVTTSVGAEGIDAKNGKEIFIAASATETYNTLNYLMQNTEEINKCAENAFIFVQQNYNNNLIVDELRGFYTKHLSI